jgi:hypothetical protein
MDCQILKGDSARAFVARSHVIATKFDFHAFWQGASFRARRKSGVQRTARPTNLKAHVRWEIFAIPDRAASVQDI